jgi:hypothetical protein
MEDMPHAQPLDDDLLEQIREDELTDILQRVRADEIADRIELDGA